MCAPGDGVHTVLFLLRHRHARPWMLLAAVVWVVASIATQWHEIVVPHARCPEHGELLEISQVEKGGQPEIAAAPTDPHHDACAFQFLGGAGLTSIRAQIATPEPPPSAEVLALASARLASYPLRFAPKTSPPHA